MEQLGLELVLTWDASTVGSGFTHYTTAGPKNITFQFNSKYISVNYILDKCFLKKALNFGAMFLVAQ